PFDRWNHGLDALVEPGRAGGVSEGGHIANLMLNLSISRSEKTKRRCLVAAQVRGPPRYVKARTQSLSRARDFKRSATAEAWSRPARAQAGSRAGSGPTWRAGHRLRSRSRRSPPPDPVDPSAGENFACAVGAPPTLRRHAAGAAA